MIVLLTVLLGALSLQAEHADDLDAFMEKVLARRDQNRTIREQYVLDERESLEILGPGRFPLRRMNRDYTWYVRDGMHVRSPVRFDGVTVSEQDRDAYEARWIRRERERAERKRQREQEQQKASSPPEAAPTDQQSVVAQLSEPRFVSEAYFMDFKFEPGNYYLAGRETLEGTPVLRIEYYPTRLFTDEDQGRDRKERAGESRERRRDRDVEQDINRKMNKTALVTLWVDPAEHQIVKYTFENVWMDFLPGRWVVTVDAIRASMSMGQPFPGVWLPKQLEVGGAITLASGSYEFTYARAFSGYREAAVTSKIRVPR